MIMLKNIQLENQSEIIFSELKKIMEKITNIIIY